MTKETQTKFLAIKRCSDSSSGALRVVGNTAGTYAEAEKWLANYQSIYGGDTWASVREWFQYWGWNKNLLW